MTRHIQWNVWRQGAAVLTLALLVEFAVLGIAFAQAPMPGMFGNQPGFKYPTGYSFAYKGVAYSACFTAINAPLGATLTWSISSGSLPTGLTIASGSGCITGTPTGSGSSTFTVQWTTGGSTPVTSTTPIISITVNTLSAVAVTPTGQSIAVSATLQMIAGCTWIPSPGISPAPPCPVAWSGSGAPAGSFSSIGSSTGLLTAGSTAGTVTVQATSTSATGSVVGMTTVTVTSPVTTPKITNATTLPSPCDIGFPCATTQLNATGGTAPYTFAAVSGTPGGCSVSSAGVIACTPTASGTFNSFVIRVTDSLSATSTTTFTLTVGSLLAGTAGRVAACAQSSIALGSSTVCTATAVFSDGGRQPLPAGGSASLGAAVGNSGAGVSSVTVLSTIAAGTPYFAQCRQGTNNTDACTFLDSASQIATILGTNTAYGGHYLANACSLNPGGITSVTATKANPGVTANMVIIVQPMPGGSCTTDATPQDNQINAPPQTNTSLMTGTITTSNPDFVFVSQDVGQGQNGFTVPSPFTISCGGTCAQSGLASAIYSAPQANLNTTISWNPTAVVAAGNIIVPLRIATGNGAVWVATNGANTNGTFVANANTGAATTSFSYQGSSSNVVAITVTGGTSDTALCVNTSGPANPCPTVNVSGTVGGANIQLTASGNVTGASYTTAPGVNWGSSNQALVVSNGGGSYACKAVTTTPVPVSVTSPGLTGGTANVSCSNPVTGSGLLSGCLYIGTGGCALPAGWTLVAQQDFECVNSHAYPVANPGCGQMPPNQAAFFSTSVNQHANHTPGGSWSAGGQYTSDASQVTWIFNPAGGSVGNINSIDMHWYDWTDSNALFGNSDYQYGNLGGHAQGTSFCTVGDNAQFGSGASSASTDLLVSISGDPSSLTCQGGAVTLGVQGNSVGASVNIAAGTWTEWELLVTPNTSYTTPIPANPDAGGGPNQIDCNNASPSTAGCGNGRLAIWRNGVKLWDETNLNVCGNNCSQFLSDPEAVVGGYLTDFAVPPNSGDANGRCNPFSICPGPTPGTGAPTPFNRNFDDFTMVKQ